MNSHDIIIRPLMSEKAYSGIPNKTYTFVVDFKATKTQIKKAVEECFNVKVEKVNTAIMPAKPKTSGNRRDIYGQTSQFKKAIVKLTSDSKAIEFFESLS
jgi:large subunit ribosomal protein L23